jgi:hypothetical protein
MSNSELLLKQAAQEISRLRDQNFLMSLRLNMFDDIMFLLKNKFISKTQDTRHPDILSEIENSLTHKVKQN